MVVKVSEAPLGSLLGLGVPQGDSGAAVADALALLVRRKPCRGVPHGHGRVYVPSLAPARAGLVSTEGVRAAIGLPCAARRAGRPARAPSGVDTCQTHV